MRLSTSCCVKRAHLQHVDVAIKKIASIEYDRLETDVRSASSGMDTVLCHEVLLRTLGWDSPNSCAIL
jgi:hypothetical protein